MKNTYFFYYNMQNYARYGSYYAELLSSLEANYPGLKDQLSKKRIFNLSPR